MRLTTCIIVSAATLSLPVGCVRQRPADTGMSHARLERRAMECLKAAIRYEYNPVVRVEAVEALELCGGSEAAPWIRSALLDVHPACRFAACVALGQLGDATAGSALRQRLKDENASVQVAALFALHRLGYTDQTGHMPAYLLDHDDPTVRRNAALVFGLMDEPGALKMLARAMKDPDAGVRNHTLEAMARLGNPEARQELVFMTSAGVGSDEVFALHALAQTRDATYLDTFRYKLQNAPHIETQLAAARGLGILGSDEGLTVALRALRTGGEPIDDPDDPPGDQRLRIRQLAAGALGEIGRVDALSALAEVMNASSDPRLQVSAAQAVVLIVRATKTQTLPFGVKKARGKR